MNLTEWADAQGIHVQTAYRWYREGTLPVPVQKVGRLFLVSPQTAAEAAWKTEGAGLYARVSSRGQRSGMGGRLARLSAWAAEAGLPVVWVEAGAGSGVSGSRAQVRRLLPDLAVTVVVAGPQGRLGRVNTELVEAAQSAPSRRLVVLGSGEVTGDLVRGMVAVLAWLCARFYGRRPARDRALEAVGCAPQGIGPRAVKVLACGGGV